MNDPKRVKVGPKNKHLVIPGDWSQVLEGHVQEGDMFADLATYEWSVVDADDLQAEVSDFDCLIRKTVPVNRFSSDRVMKFLPRKEEKALEAIFTRLEAWFARNDERLWSLPCPTPAREGIDAAHSGLAKALSAIVPPSHETPPKK